jgi:hypothetical protein
VHGDPGDPELLGAFVEGSTRPEEALPEDPLSHVEFRDELPELLGCEREGVLLGEALHPVEKCRRWRGAVHQKQVFGGVSEVVDGKCLVELWWRNSRFVLRRGCSS